MASIAQPAPIAARDDRFFFYAAIAMAAVLVAGFSTQLAMGRSSFDAPLIKHLHALAFFGWVAIFVTQTGLATSGSMALHRRLGWIGAGWVALLVVMGTALTVFVVREGTAPFFFHPQHFLIANPIGVSVFAGLTAAAIVYRRRTDWHRRLHLCGMTALIGPGFGRLLPMPLMTPYSFQIADALGLIFPAIGILRDWRRTGRVHHAWLWGVAVLVLARLLGEAIVVSPLGDAIYAWVTAGSPGTGVDGLAFAPPPGP